MRAFFPFVVALVTWAAPAAAQFNVYYTGTQLAAGKSLPCSTQFSVEKGRAAMVLHGAGHFRMLFVEKEGKLQVVDDDSRTWLFLDRKQLADLLDQMNQMTKQLEQLPPAQREMAAKMMPGAMAAPHPAPSTYVWSTDTMTVSGYPCTRVDIMQGDVKRAEYWGTKSPVFRLSEGERNTMLAMQGCLRDFVIMVQQTGMGGAETRPFQWDAGTDGYPLISRCFDGDRMTLDLHYASSDHQPIREAVFQVPDGYQKQDLGGMNPKGRGRPHAPEGQRNR